jgi:CelD/BcsL family acetyltransferase involved in cellulose biosynthesis
MFLGESLPGHGWAARLDAAYSSREGSPVVRGPWADWDEYLAGRSSNFRQELRRKERRLVEQGLRYRLVTSPEELDPALDLLFDLHRARWGAEASPWFAGQEGFHRAFARTVLPHGWLRLAVLELDRGPVAVNHCFRFGSSDWSYQFGRDPSPELGSVGILTAAFGIRDAIEAGLDFELGPGNQAYKLRFATEDQGLETVAVGRGVRGQAALLALRRRAS